MSYLKYWDVNNLYGRAISQKLSVSDFKEVEEISQFNEEFIKSYNEESNEGNFLEVNIQYPEKLKEPFLPETMKIEKVEKLVANFHHKKEYIIHIRNLKETD